MRTHTPHTQHTHTYGAQRCKRFRHFSLLLPASRGQRAEGERKERERRRKERERRKESRLTWTTCPSPFSPASPCLLLSPADCHTLTAWLHRLHAPALYLPEQRRFSLVPELVSSPAAPQPRHSPRASGLRLRAKRRHQPQEAQPCGTAGACSRAAAACRRPRVAC